MRLSHDIDSVTADVALQVTKRQDGLGPVNRGWVGPSAVKKRSIYGVPEHIDLAPKTRRIVRAFLHK